MLSCKYYGISSLCVKYEFISLITHIPVSLILLKNRVWYLINNCKTFLSSLIIEMWNDPISDIRQTLQLKGDLVRNLGKHQIWYLRIKKHSHLVPPTETYTYTKLIYGGIDYHKYKGLIIWIVQCCHLCLYVIEYLL